MKSYPDIFDLREWDITLLKRYQPVFFKSHKICHLCALGPCRPLTNLSLTETKNLPLASYSFAKGRPANPLPSPSPKEEVKRMIGKCGIDENGFKARECLLDAVIGTSGHASHAIRLLDDLIKRYGKESPIDTGHHTIIPTPIITLITGCKPKTLSELRAILTYIEGQLTHLLSSTGFGAEASPEDFVSKMLHAGMLDNLAMEVADIAQISAMSMPKGESDSKIITIGLETIDTSKPVILIVGHNSSIAHELIHLLEQRGIKENIEVCGLCCAASDSVRHSHDFKIIGNQSSQIDVIKSGVADIIILDTQCIRADVIHEARRAKSLVIATTQETALGLEDLTDTRSDKIIEYILKNSTVVILDKKKTAEAAVKIVASKQWSVIRNRKEVEMMRNLEDEQKFLTSYPLNLSIPGFLRIGRGPIRDSEIRGVAPSIVMGEIPGIIGIFGCPEEKGQGARGEGQEIQKLAEEFLKRGYIISTGGCASMDIARSDLFKNNPDSFDSSNLTNLGSCVSASHLIGACIKIAQIMCHRKLEGNYAEIADYIINRVGAVVVLWGAFTQKAFSSALGMARLGIPVVFGPRFKNYGIGLFGKDNGWMVKDKRFGDAIHTGPAPQNLLCFAEGIDAIIPLTAKLCIRPNDTTEGRKAKLKNYIELYKMSNKVLPPDIKLFIRTHYDIPEGFYEEIKSILTESKWQPTFIPDAASV